ncbi:PqqD family protein [Rathayibacter sp. SD072]|uniref:PqqD family protein n=1 Tax=Rathayibacter sp. SD072 TaxID=2781731 RepID=UPI001A964F20|nr:PqqD family protein [Rathayibacter sp. SD072]MBO0982871.1 PqqD family protein [Rathayibacter sp. SD072]
MRDDRPGNHVLPQRVALRLAAVLALHLTASAGVRGLIVKGEALAWQGIRAPRSSADVDLWVDPRRFEAALAALRAAGWARRPEALSWTLFIDHSVTLVHPWWPCDIDVHRSFPGALSAESTVFESIWASRVLMPYEESAVPVPDRAHHVVVHALHHLRSGRSADSRAAVERLAVLVGGWSAADREAVRDASVELGAQGPLAVLLEEWGVPADADPAHRTGQSLWEVRRRSDRHTFNWLHAIAIAPWRLKGLLIARAVFPTRADLEASHPALVERPRSIVRLRIRAERSLRGLRRLPSAVADLREVARLGRADERSGDRTVIPPAEHLGETAVAAPAAAVDDPRSPRSNDGQAPSAGFVVESDGDDVYVLDLGRPDEAPVVLSSSGYEIWRRALVHGESSAAIVRDLSGVFGIDPHLIEEDVENFVADLARYFPTAAPRSTGGGR